MVPPPNGAPPAWSTRPTGSVPTTICGSLATSSTPALAATAASQPWKSNSGSAVMATVVSMAAVPHSARLATACAGQ